MKLSRGDALMVGAHEHNLTHTQRRKNAILRLLFQGLVMIDKKLSIARHDVASR
ncbi:hypothetical protein N5O88_20520 [Pseudomonas sp. GD03721]|nr:MULTISPECIES: hypothetical protein [unclassified Pseudomonas]MDH1441514.1 hypothetical protein [Pseudomonas sp. GD03722]WGG01393.1 hypothetical protein N5O88_20520 [Pseudomonas sp. GD03721]WGG05561.1 hypothetical protein N5O87_20550 [Pseudomonas sp. GD03919]